jgi:hypothetical protein
MDRPLGSNPARSSVRRACGPSAAELRVDRLDGGWVGAAAVLGRVAAISLCFVLLGRRSFVALVPALLAHPRLHTRKGCAVSTSVHPIRTPHLNAGG